MEMRTTAPKNGDWALAFPHSEHNKPKAEATERGATTAFSQEYDRRRKIPRAATWSMADVLAEPQ
jgi:hypothetical protein